MTEPVRPSSNGHLQPYHLAPARPGEQRQEPLVTVPIVIRALRRWWKVALPLALLLAGGASAGLYLLFEPVYEASAWLQIEDRPKRIAFPVEFDSAKFVQTQVEIIRSPLVLGPVVSRPEVAQLEELRKAAEVTSPLDHLTRNIKIKAVGGSELYTISWQGPSAEGAATIVNAAVETYLQLRKHQDDKRMQRVIELIQQERDRQEKEVERLQEGVRAKAKELAIQDPLGVKNYEKAPVVMHEVTSLQSRLTDAEVQRVFLEAEIAAYEQSPQRAEVSEPEIDRAIAEHPEVRAREGQLAQQRAALQEMESKLASKTDPRYQSRLAAAQEQERLFQKQREELRKQVKADLDRTQVAQNRGRVNSLKSELRSAQLTQELLKKRLEEARKNTTASSTGSVELAFLQAELKREEDVYERIASRLVALRTEQRAPEQVSLLQKAEAPSVPMVANPYKRVVLGGLAGFALPFVLVVLLERLLQRISESRQIKEQLHLPMVREITQLPLGPRSLGRDPPRRVRRDLELFRESIDSLQVSLMTSESFQGLRVLAVTSPANSEGKTSVSVQLAASIARASGQRTLLIDADMRSPDVHIVLGIEFGPGLAEVLSHEIPMDELPIVPWAACLDVLRAGKLRRSPHRLLGNGDFAVLLDTLRQRYQYIIIDTPPVLAASESVLLSRAADACLLCTMRDVSRMDQVTETHARLVAAGARPIGVVLNGVPVGHYSYYYGRYGHSHDSEVEG